MLYLENRRRWSYTFGVLAAAFTLSACSALNIHEAMIPGDGTVTLAADAAKMPIKVGLYYDQTFESEETRQSAFAKHIVKFRVGPAATRYLNQAMAATFSHVEKISKLPESSAPNSRLDAVIEPQMVEFHYGRSGLMARSALVRISHRFKVYDRSGQVVASWAETGQSVKKIGGSETIYTTAGRAADDALQQVASRFAAGFAKKPEIQRWYRMSRGIVPDKEKELAAEREIRGNIIIAATPVLDDKEQDKVFGTPINPAGVLPIKLSISNGGEREFQLRYDNIVLAPKTGEGFAPENASVVLSRVTPPTSSGTVGLFAGPIAAVLVAGGESSARYHRGLNYHKMKFPDARLAKGDSAQGYVYYLAGKDDSKLQGANLRVRIIDVETGGSFVHDVPIGPIHRSTK